MELIDWKEYPMQGVPAHYWWTLVLRGILAVLFGLVSLFWPGITLTALVLLFAVWALVDGAFAIAATLGAGDRHAPWWQHLLEGLFGIGAGLVTLFYPGITALVLVLIMASWAVVTGVLEIAAAIRLRHVIRSEWLLGLSGALSILFGALLFVFPGAGALAVVWMIGVYAIAFGILLTVLGFKLRSSVRRIFHNVAAAT